MRLSCWFEGRGFRTMNENREPNHKRVHSAPRGVVPACDCGSVGIRVIQPMIRSGYRVWHVCASSGLVVGVDPVHEPFLAEPSCSDPLCEVCG